jgi:hypothetical protein
MAAADGHRGEAAKYGGDKHFQKDFVGGGPNLGGSRDGPHHQMPPQSYGTVIPKTLNLNAFAFRLCGLSGDEVKLGRLVRKIFMVSSHRCHQ